MISKIENFINVIANSPVYQQSIIHGLIATVSIAIIGFIIGIIIGSLIAIISVTPYKFLPIKILDTINNIYVTFFRGTPMVVQLLLAYYVILPSLGVKNVSTVVVGACVFGLNSSAYISEIMRGGLNSVDHGQLEAARALGLSYNVAMIKIVIGQAIKNVVPTLGNEFITLIKETSVLSFICIVDLYKAFKDIGSFLYEYTIPYIALALIYIIMVFIISCIVKFIEKKLNYTEIKGVI